MYLKHMTLAAIFVIAGILPLAASESHHDHAKTATVASTGKQQTKCPIKGGEIDKTVFIDYKGKRIFFCCPGCDKKFKADADALIAKMEADGIELAATPAAQTVCPVSEEEIDKSVFVDYQGRRVFFCCKRCRGKFNKDPEKYLARLVPHDAAPDKASDKDDDGAHHEHEEPQGDH